MSRLSSGEGRAEKRVPHRGVLFYGAIALSAGLAATGASGSGCSSSGGGSSSVSCPSDKLANVKTSYQFMDGKLGRTHDAAIWSAGYVGNLMQEAYSCIDPNVQNGIVQWTDQTRSEDYNNYVDEHGDSLTDQLEFSWEEFTDQIPGDHQAHALAMIESTSSVDDAALADSTYYEGCGDCQNGQREQYAEEVYGDAHKYDW